MLGPINPFMSDFLEPGTEMPMNTGFSGDSGAFRARLGTALDDAGAGTQLPLPIEEGEFLPLNGKNLPTDISLTAAEPDPLHATRSIIAFSDENTRDLLPVTGDGRLPVAGIDVIQSQRLPKPDVIDGELLMQDPRAGTGDESANAGDNAGIAALADSPATNPVPVAQVPPSDALKLQEQAHSSAHTRENMQRQLPLTPLPVDRQAADSVAVRPEPQPVDLTARVAMPDRISSSGMDGNVPVNAGAAALTLRQVAEKLDGTQKGVSAISSSSATTTLDTLAPLHAVSHPARAAGSPPPVQATINVPVLDEGWTEALNERVLWMTGKSIQKAEIRLNPADMGPIRVEVSVADDVATVTFNAQHALTREAIELAMPRLREMLSENGMSLADTDVSDSGVGQGENADANELAQGSHDDIGDAEGGMTVASSPLGSGSPNALVDTFV